MPVDPSFSRTQSGNVFFALFGAVGLVGVIGAASMTILKGPVAGMQKVTKYTVAENAMIAAGRLSIVAANADCDDDGVNEPLEWADAGAEPAPSGGGLIPSAIGAAKQDPWGNTYGYCVWDHGAAIDNAGCSGASQNRLAGDADIESDAGGIVIALISSGPDRVFQTSCGDDPDYVTKPSGSDDIVLTYTYGEASDLAGGLWQPKGDETAEIARDLEVYSAADPNTQIFGLDSASDPTKPSIKVDFIQKLSAGAPGVTFLSDLLVDGGKVGIGTNAPLDILDIYKAGTGTGGLRVSSDAGTRISLTANRAVGALNPLTQAGDALLYFSESSQNTGGLVIGPWSGSAAGMRITSAGNVGIGTATPSAALDVAGEFRSSVGNSASRLTHNPNESTLWLQDTANNKYWQYKHDIANGNRLNIMHYDGATWSAPLVVLPSGSVGIGTPSPTRLLHIVGSGEAAMLESTGLFSSLRFKANSTGASKDLLMHYGGNSAAQQNQLRFGRYAYDGGGWEASPVVFDLDAPNSSLLVREDGWVVMGVAADNHGLHINDSSTKYYQMLATNNNASGRAGFMAKHGANAGFVYQQTSDGIGVLENNAGNIQYYAREAGAHVFRTTNSNLTRFTIENDGRLNAHNNRIINLATPTAGSDAATKAYVDTTAADAAAAAADNLGNHTATQNLNMANRKIVSLAGPTAGTDAATKAYVDLTAASAASAAADNLGNHTATQTLAMGAYGISSSAGVIRDGNGGWVRTYGNTGWYNGTHQGGWYMNDTDWLRAYNNKNIVTGGVIRADGGFNVDGFDTINSNGSELRLRNTGAVGWTSIRMDGAESTKTLRLHYGGSSDNTLRFGSYADNFSATWNGNPVIFDLDAPDQTLVVEEAGSVKIGGQLNVSSNKIINVADPTAAQDAATKAYVDTAVGAGGGDADTLSGMSATSAATANTIMARNGNADTWVRYLHSQYVNMSHSAATRNADTVFYSSTDDYIRKNTAAGFRTSLDVYSKGEASGLFVSSSRTLTAGTGITGGGNLSADRTFSFDTTWGDARYTNKAGDTMTGNLFFSGGTRYTGTSSNNNFIIRTNNADRLTITAAGAATFSGNLTVGGTLSMGGSKVTNVAAPTAAQDAATKAYVDANAGISEVTTAFCNALNSPCTASCPAGYFRTGCSAFSPNSSLNYGAYPNGANGCSCQASSDTGVNCYAYCAK